MLSIDVTKKCLVAEGWCPVFATNQVLISLCFSFPPMGSYLNRLILKMQIQSVLDRAIFDSNSQVGVIFQVLRTEEPPPTFFRTNKVTSAFQEIVDAYG